jgi:hypothetical protein
MENSIENIWKQGFLNENSLVVPKINDLYNKRSIHIIDKMKRMYKINIILIVNMSILIPVMYGVMGAIWEGIVISTMLLLTLWYSLLQNRDFKTLDYGANSLEYLRSFDRLLSERLAKSEKIFRFTYPLYFIIACTAAWSMWNKQGITQKWHQKYPDHIYIGDAPLYALVIVGILTLLTLYFSDKIYRWDVRIVYGRIFDKLKETIAEMEKLKQGE